jgi:hypothetical protein
VPLLGQQEPSANLCGQYQPFPLVLACIAPCVGHCGVVAVVWALTAGLSPRLRIGWLSSATRNLSLATLVRHRGRRYP